MTRAMLATVLLALVAPHGAMAQESVGRSAAACKEIVARSSDRAGLAELSDDQLKERMCLSSLSVVRSADSMAVMDCRVAFNVLSGEFSRRHPGKAMAEVYGRC